jgi:RNA-binding protein Nova
MAPCSGLASAFWNQPEEPLPIKLKLLFSQQSSGIIIGRRGAFVSQLQAQSEARIRLSKHNEVFPGTSDRLLFMQGTMPAVLAALYRMVTHLLQQGLHGGSAIAQLGDRGDHTELVTIKLLIPDEVCGFYIGHGGETIRQLAATSGAQVVVSKKVARLRERMVTVTGTVAQTIRAVGSSLVSLASNPEYLENPLLSQLDYYYSPATSGALL